MKAEPKNLFWDSCIFIRYLTQTPTEFVDEIGDYIKDAKKGEYRIWYSTITLAEIRPSHLKKRGYGSIAEFFADFQGAFHPVESNPNIMMMVAELRDVPRSHPTKENAVNKWPIGTPDAIQLASCLYLRDVIGVKDIKFHSFDTGSGKTWEGRCVGLINFEEWFPDSIGKHHLIDGVCAIPRTLPHHPQPRLQIPGPAYASSTPPVAGNGP